jgi:hypothetical protein
MRYLGGVKEFWPGPSSTPHVGRVQALRREALKTHLVFRSRTSSHLSILQSDFTRCIQNVNLMNYDQKIVYKQMKIHVNLASRSKLP